MPRFIPLYACLASAIETQEDILTDVLLDDEWSLTLFNDHHNTFDHVIECLMTTCGHDALQAEQCAMIVHFKGKCTNPLLSSNSGRGLLELVCLPLE